MPVDTQYMSDPKVQRGLNGLGLFATRPYAKDDFVIEYTGEKITSDEAQRRGGKYLFEINKHWTLDGRDRTHTARYLNHSCRPNCYAELDEDEERIYIRAKKKIAPGDELTFHYGKTYFEDQILPKGCACEKCRESATH